MVAGVISAVFFPALIALDIIAFTNWNPLYDFPIVFTFGLVARAVVLKVIGIEASLRNSNVSFNLLTCGITITRTKTKTKTRTKKGYILMTENILEKILTG